MSPFAALGEEPLWSGSLVSLARGRFSAPDGTEFERELVHHPGAVSVVPVTAGGEVVLVRQYRAAIDAELLEIPAGKRDVAGEPFEVTAARELEEEVGLRAGRLERLAEFYNSPGFCDEHSVVFLALDLSPCDSDAQGVEETHMTVERLALDDAASLVESGGIVDAKTIIGICLALRRLGRDGTAAR